jgi:HEPN domain-containing protein
MKKTTREWVQKAEADFRAAAELGRKRTRYHDQVCFLCQQCVEKYLKALLEEFGLPIPHTHILRDLLALLLPHFASLLRWRRGLIFLTRFAVGTRYPGDSASKRQARAAQRWAGKMRDAIRQLLGIRPPHKRRKKPR